MIALEPEAAAIFCQEKNLNDFYSETGRRSVDGMLSQPNTNYMVIDIGGMLLFCFILFLYMILMYARRLIRPLSVANLWTLTVRLLEQEYLEEDGPITTFFEYKRFSTEFFDWTNKIRGSLINATIENSKPF